LAEYRSDGRSSGEPDLEAFPSDAHAFYDRLASMPQVDRGRIVVLGRSLDGAAAAAVAHSRAPRAVVLQQTVTTLADMVAEAGLPRSLAGDALDCLSAVKAYSGPIFLGHGRADGIIPFAHGQRLAVAAADRSQGRHRFAAFDRRYSTITLFSEIRAAVLDSLSETLCRAMAGS